MNQEIKIEKNDILQHIYFIAEMSQNSGEKGMYGTLAGKSDFMGGIFDRWINIIPESAIFNKYLLPKISNGKKVEIITDFYKYAPKQETTGIAPDVLGLRVNDTIIPFITFNEKWSPIEEMPQIEVKTFKKSQQMVSLRDQGYDGKYLILVESNYRVDYLLPFFDNSFFSEEVYNKMTMDDKIFIQSNSKGLISHLKAVDITREDLGTLKLLVVTTTKKFQKISTFCEAGVSPIRIGTIEKCDLKNIEINTNPLEGYCSKQAKNIFRFNINWYDGIEKEIPYFLTESKTGSRKSFVRVLDFYCDKISSIQLLKKNKNNFYIKTNNDCTLNTTSLKKNTMYKISLNILDRASSSNGEYFLQKELINFVPNYEQKLLDTLKDIINKGDR